ncbi:hypothetical protein HAX54_000396 [Datura stramonium]|uniref:Uncharacterized protein n=1 Tax=Datura stramonium TaxID=4076 RepID=A0ABS8T1L2_DATST|nr:hypothetical protein [Datura stramonium]
MDIMTKRKIVQPFVDEPYGANIDIGDGSKCKIDDEVVIRLHIDMFNEEAVVDLKRKEKVKDNMVEIVKYYSKPIPSIPQRKPTKKTLDAKIYKHVERLNEATKRVARKKTKLMGCGSKGRKWVRKPIPRDDSTIG